MKISIAICTYNGEKYIDEFLESIINQERKVDEVIIVDDASSDFTLNKVKFFIKKNGVRCNNWRVIENKENIGFISNFRKALSYTSGDLVFLADQDDVWKTRKVSTMEKIILQNPEIQGLCSTYNLTNENNELIRLGDNSHKLVKVDFDTLYFKNIMPGCTSAYKRKIIELFLESAENNMEHDWLLNIYAADQRGLFLYKEPLVDYRQHSNNAIGIKNDSFMSKVGRSLNYWDIYLQKQYERVSRISCLKGLMNAHDFQKVINFVKIRNQNISKRKLTIWLLEVLIYFQNYKNCMDYKGIVMDLLRLMVSRDENENKDK